MAKQTAESTVLVKIAIDEEDSALTKQEQYRLSIKRITDEKKALEAANKKGQLTEKEYIREITRAETSLKTQRAEYSKATQAVTGHKNVIDKLTDAVNKNTQAQQNSNKSFQEATPALDKVSGGAASAATGFVSMARAALAFIATPIGAVVAALGLAIAALTAYFKGSEEGQDRLTKITTITTVALNKLMVVVEDIGETIFNSAEGVNTMTQKLGVFGIALDVALIPLRLFLFGLEKIADFTGLTKVVDDTVKTGKAIADLNDQIEARENELILRRAEINKKVQELREKAITQEGKLKFDTISEAIRLEKLLASEEKKQLEDKLKALDLENETTGRLTEEQKKQHKELEAAIVNAEAEGASATIKFQKQLEALRDEQVKAADQRRQDELKKAQEHQDALDKITHKETIESIQEFADQEATIAIDTANKKISTELLFANAQQSIQDKIDKGKAQSAKIQSDIEKGRVDEAIDSATRLSTGLTALGIRNRIIQSGVALANTFVAVTEILSEKSLLPFPASVIAKGAAIVGTVATGLAAVARINGVQFGRGGVLEKFHGGGVLSGPSHARGGIPFTVAGRPGFEAEGGEAIINKRSSRIFRKELSEINAAGGGVRFASGGLTSEVTRSASQSAIASQNSFDAIINGMSRLNLVVYADDISAKQKVNSRTQQKAQVL